MAVCSRLEPAATEFPCVPQDVQYSDIDYMERQLDFTLSPKFAGFPALINRMKADGMRVILILVCPSVNGRSILGAWIRFGGENFTHTVFPFMLCAEKLRVKEKLYSSGGS